MNDDEQGAGSGAFLADIRRVVEVGLVAANGRLDVIIERLEQQDRRTEQHAQQVAALDARMDEMERTAVTRTDMDARGRRTVSIVAVVVSVIAALVGTLTTVIITLTT